MRKEETKRKKRARKLWWKLNRVKKRRKTKSSRKESERIEKSQSIWRNGARKRCEQQKRRRDSDWLFTGHVRDRKHWRASQQIKKVRKVWKIDQRTKKCQPKTAKEDSKVVQIEKWNVKSLKRSFCMWATQSRFRTANEQKPRRKKANNLGKLNCFESKTNEKWIAHADSLS